ncbi:MAG: hypothetical protein M3O34_14230, partial [Chloroflexota bacterium]|nr:hypothetical protein [Chloroflexota bacterium]
VRFRAAWRAGNPEHGPAPTGRVAEIDRVLHAERVEGTGRAARRRTWRSPIGELPDGALVILDAAPDAPLLVWRGYLRRWSFAGYGPPQCGPSDMVVVVLTPPSIVAAIRAGYAPTVHPSADRAAREAAVPVSPAPELGRYTPGL